MDWPRRRSQQQSSSNSSNSNNSSSSSSSSSNSSSGEAGQKRHANTTHVKNSKKAKHVNSSSKSKAAGPPKKDHAATKSNDICPKCASCKHSFATWGAFDAHVDAHGARGCVNMITKTIARVGDLAVDEVIACSETMHILDSLVVEDGPTFVYQDAGYLTTDVLRRMAMTTIHGPQPKKPIGPSGDCGDVAIFIIVCVHRWKGLPLAHTKKSVLRFFARVHGPSPPFVHPSGITYHTILTKRLTGQALTAEENEATRVPSRSKMCLLHHVHTHPTPCQRTCTCTVHSWSHPKPPTVQVPSLVHWRPLWTNLCLVVGRLVRLKSSRCTSASVVLSGSSTFTTM